MMAVQTTAFSPTTGRCGSCDCRTTDGIQRSSLAVRSLLIGSEPVRTSKQRHPRKRATSNFVVDVVLKDRYGHSDTVRYPVVAKSRAEALKKVKKERLTVTKVTV